jgi:hypothetical protein
MDACPDRICLLAAHVKGQIEAVCGRYDDNKTVCKQPVLAARREV